MIKYIVNIQVLLLHRQVYHLRGGGRHGWIPKRQGSILHVAKLLMLYQSRRIISVISSRSSGRVEGDSTAHRAVYGSSS